VVTTTTTVVSPISVDAEVQKQVLDKCAALHASIMPLNEKLRGPLAKHSDKGTSLPFVFLVGNHSSGKSSFVNYVMGRTIQTAGVAPTDDCFTVIAPGPSDTDQDGPALVGDPDMGFMNLRQFGPTLIHHTQLKVRRDIMTTNFMLVDSPGMIDSPVSSREMDRGYDFKGVVRWFAERADVVLLFFDPDKPGTTGETLSVLLHSLAGMDHKLLIVLNKADQFKKVRVNTCFSKVTFFFATTQAKLSLRAHTHTCPYHNFISHSPINRFTTLLALTVLSVGIYPRSFLARTCLASIPCVCLSRRIPRHHLWRAWPICIRPDMMLWRRS
jgi:GTP-binding protein EngB required for normal cell division